MEIHKKKLSTQIIGGIGFGLFVNVSLVFLLAYVLFLKEYGGEGLEKMFNELVLRPSFLFSVVILGDTHNNRIYEILHMLYTDLKIQGFYWLSFFAFVYISITNKKTMETRNAAEYGSHGSARWATDNEIKESLLKNTNGFVLGEHQKKLAVHSLDGKLNNNITAFGGSGTGKSAGFSIVNILYNCFSVGESIIITDPKGELYNTTVPTLRKNGYDVITFNLLDTKRSHRYNPIDYVENIEEAMSLAEMIISNSGGMSKDPMWTNAEIAYFAALMMYLKETRPKEEQHIKSILQLGTRIGSNEKLLDAMFFALPDDSEALEMYHIFRNAKDKTRAGILIGFGVRLKLWVSKNIANLTSTSDFDLNQLGQKKTALFLLMPDSDSTFDLLPALLIDQTFHQLYKQAGRNDSLSLNVKVRGILDEIANIAPINNFERKVSTMRSRGISVVPIFQSITQFQNRYDHDKWSEVLSSTDTIVFLGTNDKKTANYFSEKLGDTTLLINSVSEGQNRSSMNHNFVKRALMNPDEVERMSDKKVIIFQRGKYPMFIDKHMYYEQKKWSDIEKTNWTRDIEERNDSTISVFKPFRTPDVESDDESTPDFINEGDHTVNIETGEIMNDENIDKSSNVGLPEMNEEELVEAFSKDEDDYIASLMSEPPKDEIG